MLKNYIFAGLTALSCALAGAAVASEKITIGFGQDKPPFVNPDCSDGIEVRLAAELFKRAGIVTERQCMTNKRLIVSYQTGRVNAGMTVPKTDAGLFYTGPFSGFENFAVSRKADRLQIDKVGDLANVSVIAWDNAAAGLGEEFAEVATSNKRYEETKSQIAQVKKFLSGRVQVVIIDKNIMRWLTKELIASGAVSDVDTDFTYHAIFPGKLDYFIGFTDKALRDKVDASLTQMRNDGTYQSIVDEYLKF